MLICTVSDKRATFTLKSDLQIKSRNAKSCLDKHMDLLFRNCISLFINVRLRGTIFGILKRPLLRLPALCQHEPDVMETLSFKHIILLFLRGIVFGIFKNIVWISCVSKQARQDGDSISQKTRSVSTKI